MKRPFTRRRPLRLSLPLFISLLASVLLIGSLKLSRPLAAIRRQQRQLASLQLKKSALDREHQRLKREQRFLATEAGQEQLIRQKGYLRPGERRIIFLQAPTPKLSPQPQANEAPSPPLLTR